MANSTKGTTANVIPTMRYDDAPAAIEWLCRAFGFEQRMVVPGEPGIIVHAQLEFGNGMVMLSSARDTEFDKLVKLPAHLGGTTQSPYIVVQDVMQHYAQAAAAGAEIVMDPKDEGHGLMYSCRDPEGHLWNFGDYDPWAPV